MSVPPTGASTQAALDTSQGSDVRARGSSSLAASTLVSMGKTVSIGFIQFLSFFVIQSFLILRRCVGKKDAPIQYIPPKFPEKKYELHRYDDFVECFEKDPVQGFHTLLDMLEQSPNALKGVLLDMVSKAPRFSRIEVISKINEVFFGVLAAPEVLYHVEQVINANGNAEYDTKTITNLKGNDDFWKDPAGKDPKILVIRALHKQHEETRNDAKKIWGKCLGFIKILADVSSLNLENKDCYAGGQDGINITLGDFIERLHHKIGLSVLKSREERFDLLISGIIQVLNYLDNKTEVDLIKYPKFKLLVKKARDILQKEENQNELFNIIGEIIDRRVSSPTKKSSTLRAG